MSQTFGFDKYAKITIVIDSGAIAEYYIQANQVDALGARIEDGTPVVKLPTYELNSDQYSINENVVIRTQFVMDKIFSITSKPAPHIVSA